MIIKRLIKKFLPQSNVKYDDTFFQDQWFKSWQELKFTLGSLIESRPDWKKVLDFGCGPGIMIDHLNEKGTYTVGCDYSSDANKLYLTHYGQNPELYVKSLENPLCQQPFDVFLSFDVFEHLTDSEIEDVLKRVSSIPTLFLNISRARGIPGHINLKSDRSWIRFMLQQGYDFAQGETQEMRALYLSLRPSAADGWNKNLFIFHRR